MSKPLTYQQQIKEELFVPHHRLILTVIQKLYNRVYTRGSDGKVRQYYPDLGPVVEDHESVMYAA